MAARQVILKLVIVFSLNFVNNYNQVPFVQKKLIMVLIKMQYIITVKNSNQSANNRKHARYAKKLHI